MNRVSIGFLPSLKKKQNHEKCVRARVCLGGAGFPRSLGVAVW